MPKVWNKHHGDAPKNAVYIGRGSIWGNPYNITVTPMTNEEAVEKYKSLLEEMFREFPHTKEHIVNALRGKDLVCYCAPKPCHGDYLLQIANE